MVDEFKIRNVIQVPTVCDENVSRNSSLEALEGSIYRNVMRRFSSLRTLCRGQGWGTRRLWVDRQRMCHGFC